MNTRTSYSSLAFAGVTPFLACALLPLFGIETLRWLGPLDQVANSYGLAIVCFLTGIHWATHLYRQDDLDINLLIGSNIVFLFAWFAFALGSITVSLSAQAVALLLLLFIDRHLRQIGLISADYFRIRLLATTLAAIAILIILLS